MCEGGGGAKGVIPMQSTMVLIFLCEYDIYCSVLFGREMDF
jgi:hypothetical protein